MNFPKGHIEPGEKGLKIALREVAEETAIRPCDLIVHENFQAAGKYFFKKGDRGIFKIVLFYLARAKAPYVKISLEHEGYGWFLYKDALRLMKYENLRKILKSADRFLKDKKGSFLDPF